MSFNIKKYTSLKRTWIITMLLVLVFFMGDPGTIRAQSGDGEWVPPVNLSRSGGALNPSIVIDNNGITHMIWADTYAGFMYSVLSEEGWSTPKSVIFPFSPPRNVTIGPDYPTPALFTDQRNRIHAFWIDGRGVLNHSSVSALYIDSPGSWIGKRVIAEAAIAMDVTSDANQNLHVAYIRNTSSYYSPAGLYYRWLNTTTYYWALPTLLDESPYFRSLVPENANVQITSTWVDETVNLMIGWDNRPRNRISLIKSNDSGATWGDVKVIEGPEVSINPVIPFNLRIGSHDKYSLLVWQEDEPGESCNQVYQYSNDGGETWQGKQRMLTNLQGCAEDYQFVIREDGQMILMTKILGQVYFQAWDGQRWSDPQLQTILSSFIDQETFNLVDLDCHFALLTPSNDLYVAGCDQGIGGDVWLTSRKIDIVASWFPSETNWSIPVNIVNGRVLTLTSSMVADAAGNMHVIWSMVEDPSDEGAVLQYARTDGTNWSPPQILFGPPVHYVGSTALATNNGKLFAVWNDQSTGEILISSAAADRASNSREWTSPVSVPLPRKEGNSPALVAGSEGMLYLAYAIPINEMRGIYVALSEDEGITWSEPIQVFDAVLAGWPMVDHPKITIGDDGAIHLIFSRYNASSRSDGLYYTLSNDLGETWTNVDVISEAGIRFSDVQKAGNGVIHVLWLESGNTHSLWHAYFDDPLSRWENRRSVQTSIIEPKISPLLEDAQGGIHLLQLSNEGQDEITLKHWLWNEPQWSVAELYQIQVNSSFNASAVVGAISSKGQMSAVYALPVMDERVNSETVSLFSVSRALDVAMKEPIEQVVEVEQEEIVEPSIGVVTPETAPAQPTAETAMIADEYRPEIDSSPVERPNEWSGLAIGVVGGGLLTIFILLIAVRSVRRRGLH
jgi:hypothetical protein